MRHVKNIEDKDDKIIQLNHTIPVITFKGNGWAFFLVERIK
jgi:hypothetical protein